MNRRIIDHDPESGISHVFYSNGDEYRVVAEQDVSSLIEANKKALIEAPDRFGEWTRVASIPLVELNRLRREGKLNDQPYLKRWLNDSDHRYFRTHPGRI